MQIESELRERIAPCVSLIGGYALVPAGKHDGLKNDAVDFVYVLNRETNDVAKPVVVEAIGYGNLERCSHSSRSDVLQGLPLDCHVISQSTMFVLFFRDSVKLKVYGVQASLLCLQSKIPAFGKMHTVGRNVKSMETHAFGVANSIENSISVVDEDSGRTLANIPVAGGPVQPLRVDEATGRVYVVCSAGQELDIIDGNTNRVTAHIPVSPEPEGVAFNTATGRIYVADEGNPDGSNSDQDTGTTITVIDGQSLAVLGTLQVGRGPDGVEADPALRRVYVSVEDSNAVVEISDSVDVVLQTDNTALQVANVRQALALLRQATIITLVLMILTMVGATIRALSPRWRGRESPRTPPGGASSHSESHTPPA